MPDQPQGRIIVPLRNRRIGLWAMILPYLILVGILILFAVTNFIVASFLGASTTSAEPSLMSSTSTAGIELAAAPHSLGLTIAKVISVVLGFLGIFAVLGILVGFVIAIVNFTHKELDTKTVYDERSGKGDLSEVPVEVKGWNWGAAGFPILWGMYHSVWLGLLAFVPFVNYVWWIVMGIRGNEWAWKSMPWESVEKFKAAQKKWKPWGITWIILEILFVIGYFFFVVAAFSFALKAEEAGL